MSFVEWFVLLSFQVVTTAVAVASGAAAWLAKVAAEHIARRDQSQLEARLKRLEASLDAATHVTKAQYEREFEIYRELWNKMLNALNAAFNLSFLPQQPQQVESFMNVIAEFAQTVVSNRPFFAEGVYEATGPFSSWLTEVRTHHMLGIGPDGTDPQRKALWITNTVENIKQQQNSIRDAIRKRMREMSTVQSDTP